MPLPLQSALAASGYVGTWDTDIDAQTVEFTGALPRLLALDEEPAAAGVPITAFLEGVHPEDREHVAHLVHEAHNTAGRFEAEFRTRDKAGATHWIVARGQVEAGRDGHGARCIGLAADITDSRQANSISTDQTVQAIERIADALITVRPLVEGLDSPTLKTLIDATLFELGRLLAEREVLGHAAEMHR
jgi:PAS fold